MSALCAIRTRMLCSGMDGRAAKGAGWIKSNAEREEIL
jgi:hypothetical protein